MPFLKDTNGHYIPTPSSQGADGREVSLRVTGSYLQWRYEDTEWANLIDLSEFMITGPSGAAATIEVGTVTTGEPGTNASVTNSGTSAAAVLDFTIPRGENGEMHKSVYDPTNKNADAFNVDNHFSGAINKVFSATDKSKLDDMASHTHGNITNDGKIGAAANLPVYTGTSGLLETKAAADASAVMGYGRGTCTTAAGTAAKVVELSNFVLVTGGMIAVKFTNTDSSTNPTLNVNSTGAKAIYYSGTNITAGMINSDLTAVFVYNGTQFELINPMPVKIGAQSTATITVNASASPALGTLSNNTEYRCTNASISTAPTMTIASIASTGTEFCTSVIYKSPGTSAPSVTNNSGYTAKWQGKDVSSGTFAPKTGSIYRLSILFDGIYLNFYVSGVA